MESLVVTRHLSLYKYLVKIGMVAEGTPCMSYADVSDVIGKHVYGVLPYNLAAKTGLYTEIQMRIPKDKHGRELSVDEVSFLAIRPRTYRVREVTHAGKQII